MIRGPRRPPGIRDGGGGELAPPPPFPSFAAGPSAEPGAVLTVNDVLDGHVVLGIECLDRIYLNACVPILQTSSQVTAFLPGHLGSPSFGTTS